MNRFENRRDAGLQECFNASFTDTLLLSHHTKCRREEVQHAAVITTPQERPRPGRRRLSMYHLPFGLTQILLLMIMVLSVLCMPTEAVEHAGSHSRAVKGHYVDGRIMYDQNPVPQPTLLRRKDPASTEPTSTTTAAEASETSTSGSSTTTTPLPRAFDGGFGTNYTQPSCPTFLRSMVNNDTFISCVPFSLLLQNSMSFFDASHSLSAITAVLDASCSVPFPTCSTLMSSFALTLRSSSACKEDYSSENPQVRQAYAGLLAYDVSHNASCLKNNNSPTTPGNNDPDAAHQNNNNNNDTNYCFADAITNKTSPTDSYVYYLPLGLRLPPGSLPTCDSCLEQTMAAYAAAASNKSQPLNLDYVDAATMVNQMCGPGYVNASIPNAGSYSGGGGGSKSSAASGRARGVDGAGAWFGLLVGAAGLIAAL